ncbi:hypothetical protein WM40_17730 [Robbsia andropogonis]|uniref:Uncharacterized protein n=1 Tax=Robbsia andropogonis TaxID=28092 RepID=A0A0F5JWS5_9BURK|nr:hypothetical protein [Robbsia andropogonis]KKB62316.1 hypothetical protein WM40_17730 [Robbsia andropogonis]MCP1121170.1 hypothetical protein [Robbsia andropogonis]MCP1130962.1 hypothetical protein [Robbsia andropogonis]
MLIVDGQSGTAFAFALQRAGIDRDSIVDAAPNASLTGVWLPRVRMKKLRTPKILVGREGAIAELGFQAWH